MLVKIPPHLQLGCRQVAAASGPGAAGSLGLRCVSPSGRLVIALVQNPRPAITLARNINVF